MAGLRYLHGGKLYDLSGDEYDPESIDVAKLKIVTNTLGGTDEYGLTLDSSATQYSPLAFNISGVNAYIGRWQTSYSASKSSEIRDISYTTTQVSYDWETFIESTYQITTTYSWSDTSAYITEYTYQGEVTKNVNRTIGVNGLTYRWWAPTNDYQKDRYTSLAWQQGVSPLNEYSTLAVPDGTWTNGTYDQYGDRITWQNALSTYESLSRYYSYNSITKIYFTGEPPVYWFFTTHVFSISRGTNSAFRTNYAYFTTRTTSGSHIYNGWNYTITVPGYGPYGLSIPSIDFEVTEELLIRGADVSSTYDGFVPEARAGYLYRSMWANLYEEIRPVYTSQATKIISSKVYLTTQNYVSTSVKETRVKYGYNQITKSSPATWYTTSASYQEATTYTTHNFNAVNEKTVTVTETLTTATKREYVPIGVYETSMRVTISDIYGTYNRRRSYWSTTTNPKWVDYAISNTYCETTIHDTELAAYYKSGKYVISTAEPPLDLFSESYSTVQVLTSSNYWGMYYEDSPLATQTDFDRYYHFNTWVMDEDISYDPKQGVWSKSVMSWSGTTSKTTVYSGTWFIQEGTCPNYTTVTTFQSDYTAYTTTSTFTTSKVSTTDTWYIVKTDSFTTTNPAFTYSTTRYSYYGSRISVQYLYNKSQSSTRYAYRPKPVQITEYSITYALNPSATTNAGRYEWYESLYELTALSGTYSTVKEVNANTTWTNISSTRSVYRDVQNQFVQNIYYYTVTNSTFTYSFDTYTTVDSSKSIDWHTYLTREGTSTTYNKDIVTFYSTAQSTYYYTNTDLTSAYSGSKIKSVTTEVRKLTHYEDEFQTTNRWEDYILTNTYTALTSTYWQTVTTTGPDITEPLTMTRDLAFNLTRYQEVDRSVRHTIRIPNVVMTLANVELGEADYSTVRSDVVYKKASYEFDTWNAWFKFSESETTGFTASTYSVTNTRYTHLTTTSSYTTSFGIPRIEE